MAFRLLIVAASAAAALAVGLSAHAKPMQNAPMQNTPMQNTAVERAF